MGSIDYPAFLRAYLAPDAAYAPVPFWFLNDALDPVEIARQLADFKAHGIHCVVLHPRIGIPESIPYLSDAFMECIKTAVAAARALSMRVILYDEGMYPSGSAGGLVVRENARFAARCVYPRYNDEPLGGDETLLIAGIINGRKVRAVHAPSKGTIRGIHFGQDSQEPGAPPAGDILNPDAVDCFIRLTHERCRQWLLEYFGGTITGFFTDEPSPMGRYPREDAFAWTWGMEQEFPLDKLMLLWQENDAGDLARTQHRRAVSARLGRVFYGRLSAWCRGNSLLLMGHPAESDEITAQKYMDIPGQDLIARVIAPENDPLASRAGVMGKLTADIARQHHRPRNLNEALGVCFRGDNPWDLPFADARWMLDHLLSRGCNMLVLHAFYYSLRGARSGERPPDVGPNSPWWKGFKPFAMYLARLCWLNTGEFTPKVAVLCHDRQVPYALVRPLYEQQVDFIYLEEEDFLSTDRRYALVLYDKMDTFSPETAARLAKCHALTAYPGQRPASPLRAQRMKMHGIDYRMFFNEGNRPACVETEGFTQVWLPFEERRLRLGREPVILAPGETAILVNAPAEELPFYGDVPQRERAAWSGPWQAANALKTLMLSDSETAAYRFSAPELAYTDYTARFVLPLYGRVFLSLHIARECAYAALNGVDAGAFLLPEQTRDVTAFTRVGDNTLCIRVMATPANSYNHAAIPCGLAALPEVTFTAAEDLP